MKSHRTEPQKLQGQLKLKQAYIPKSSQVSVSQHQSTQNTKGYHAVPYAYGVDEAYSISIRERQEGILKGN